MREVMNVLDRCRVCGIAVSVVLHEHGLDDQGSEFRAVWRESLPHNRSECERMVTLTREQWPTLW